MTTSTLTDRLHSHGITTAQQLIDRKIVAGFELSDNFFDPFIDMFVVLGLAVLWFLFLAVVFVVLAVWSNARSAK